jgi:hypothetical protein
MVSAAPAGIGGPSDRLRVGRKASEDRPMPALVDRDTLRLARSAISDHAGKEERWTTHRF